MQPSPWGACNHPHGLHAIIPWDACPFGSAGWNWFYLQLDDGSEFTGAAFNNEGNQQDEVHTIRGTRVPAGGGAPMFNISGGTVTR